MNMMTYKPGIDDVLDRLKALYERRAQDRIFASFDIPTATMSAFRKQHTEGYCTYPDPSERISFWGSLLKERLIVQDDSVPSAYLSEFDQGLYGGLVGGDVQFMCHPENGWISSMIAPLLSDWSEFDALTFDESHPWFQRYTQQLQIFIEGSRDKFGISHFILIDGLNFVFELLGATRTYMSLIEHPEMVRKAIEFAFDLNVKVQDVFLDTVPAFRGGTCSNMVQWIPGKIVSESVDPFHMTSVDYFEAWGREPVQRILDYFDGGVLHIHGNGRHLLEAVCSFKRAKAIFMGDDRGFPLAFDVLDELRVRAGDMPLVVGVEFERFVEKLDRHTLAGGAYYMVEGTPSADEANRLMERVRAYRV